MNQCLCNLKEFFVVSETVGLQFFLLIVALVVKTTSIRVLGKEYIIKSQQILLHIFQW